MKVFSVFFRLLSLLLPIALATYLWMESEVLTERSESFLDEVVSDAYSILQADKKSLWDELNSKKAAFDEAFESNEPVSSEDENPLALKFADLRSTEDALLRNSEYRDELDQLSMEFGADAFIWDSSAKRWMPNALVKLKPPTGLRDPFRDESKFPLYDRTDGDGYLTKGISRENRLRTVLGMFYRDRHNKLLEANGLRAKVVLRDRELREFQNLFYEEKGFREVLEDQVSDLTVRLNSAQAGLDKEKVDRKSEFEQAEERIEELNNGLAKLEADKIKRKAEFEMEVDALWTDHKLVIKQKNGEIRMADAAGYKRGIDTYVAKQLGGASAAMQYADALSPYPDKTDPQESIEKKEIAQEGTSSEIARIDNEAGMLVLPVGKESGATKGHVFGVWKDKREAARIRVQSSRDGYMLAHILPSFGDPEYLRRGESVLIIPVR